MYSLGIKTRFLSNRIHLLISLLEKFNVFLNNFYCKMYIYVLLNFPWQFRIQETMTIFSFNFANFFFEITKKTWKWSWHKSCTINRFYFVRYSRNSSINILTSFCNFFLEQNGKSFLKVLYFPQDIQIFPQNSLLILSLNT